MKQLAFGLVLALTSQMSLSSQILFTTAGYEQNFDTLAATGSGVAWSDGVTLTGWYSNRSAYSAGTGSASTGNLYSYGVAGESERALGSLATSTVNPVQFGLRLRNETGASISELDVSYVGEQWRVGGASAVNNTLTLAYKVAAVALAESGYTDLPGLSFDTPLDAGTAGAVNGNQSAQRVVLTGKITGLGWGAGEELWLRWTDTDNSSSDHGLAIDDLRLDLEVSPVPEPGEYGLLTAGLLVGFAWYRSRMPRTPQATT